MSILERELPKAAWVRAIVPAIGLVGLGIFVLLYLYRTDWYFRLLAILLFDHTYRFPFRDWQFVVSSIDCWNRGVDVYVNNPCDETGLLWDYSPLWLRLSFLPNDKTWTNVIGMGVAILFMVSLAWLPPPRRTRDLGLIVLATFSSATLFGLERANTDVLVFLLAVVTGVSLEQGLSGRVLGYAVAVVGGLLKFFPFVLLLLMLRERFARFVVLALLAVAVMAVFAWQYHDELPRATANVLREGHFGETFGARQLATALALWLGSAPNAPGWSGEWLLTAPRPDLFAGVLLLFLVVAIVLAATLASRSDFAAAFMDLTERERNFLLVGAALIAGCFFAGSSIGYRAMHLLFALPGVLVLARIAAGRGTRAAFRWAGYASLFVMWWQALRFIGKQVGRPVWALRAADAAWVIHELAWWLLATVFLAVLFRFVLDSTVWRFVTAAVSAQRPAGV